LWKELNHYLSKCQVRQGKLMRVKVSKGQTIVEVVRDGLCTGCGTCVGTCPVDAMETVIEHKKGIYIPHFCKA
jgi:ferredoxin